MSMKTHKILSQMFESYANTMARMCCFPLLTHADRLSVVIYNLNIKLILQLSLNPDYNTNQKQILCIVRHVVSKRMAALRNKAVKQAEELCASGQYAAAEVPLQLAINLRDLSSHALKAWLLCGNREGIVKDLKTAFELADEGARLGCHQCQGVLAYCYSWGDLIIRNEALSLELARKSSRSGNRYGQFVLGELHYSGRGGLVEDDAQALVFFKLAAAQGLDDAQFKIGMLSYQTQGVVQDYVKALRYLHLAAAQGHLLAIYQIGCFYQYGRGIKKNRDEAVRWFRRGQAAGCRNAAAML